MKTLSAFLLASFLSIAVFAAEVTGKITVSFTGNSEYYVLIDGRNFSSGNNRIYLNDVRPGRHTIEVYRAGRGNYKRNPRPIYYNEFTVRPQYDLNIIISNGGRVQFDERRSNINRRNERGNWSNQNDRDWDNNDKYNKRGQDVYGNGNNRWEDDRNYNKAVSDYDFNRIIQFISNNWYNKFNNAQDAINRNYFSAYQVKQLLQLFSSEDDRLQLAKLAYKNTVDKKSYQQLYDVFNYESSRRELENYIRNSRY